MRSAAQQSAPKRRQRVPLLPIDQLLTMDFPVWSVLTMREVATSSGTKWVVLWTAERGGLVQRKRFTNHDDATAFRDHLLSQATGGTELTTRQRKVMTKPRQRQPLPPSTPPKPPPAPKPPPKRTASPFLSGPTVMNRSEPIPHSSGRVSISTVWRNNAPLYVVGVVDQFGRPVTDPTEHLTPQAARAAANRLYQQLASTTEETA